MVRLLSVILIVALTSCREEKLRKYESIVREADRFEIFYRNKTIAVPERSVAAFKAILIRNVKPEMQHKFINDARIDVYKRNQRTATLTIDNGSENPFVNFTSSGLQFGFRLTYGIGQTIDNLYSDHSR